MKRAGRPQPRAWMILLRERDGTTVPAVQAQHIAGEEECEFVPPIVMRAITRRDQETTLALAEACR